MGITFSKRWIKVEVEDTFTAISLDVVQFINIYPLGAGKEEAYFEFRIGLDLRHGVTLSLHSHLKASSTHPIHIKDEERELNFKVTSESKEFIFSVKGKSGEVTKYVNAVKELLPYI